MPTPPTMAAILLILAGGLLAQLGLYWIAGALALVSLGITAERAF